MDNNTAGLIFKVSSVHDSKHRNLRTEALSHAWKHEVQLKKYQPPHILVRHLGPYKPNTIMCQLFLQAIFVFSPFFFFCQRKNNLFKKKQKITHQHLMSSENKCLLRERKWQYERKSTCTAYKKEALPFQPMVKVLKIKADL